MVTFEFAGGFPERLSSAFPVLSFSLSGVVTDGSSLGGNRFELRLSPSKRPSTSSSSSNNQKAQMAAILSQQLAMHSERDYHELRVDFSFKAGTVTQGNGAFHEHKAYLHLFLLPSNGASSSSSSSSSSAQRSRQSSTPKLLWTSTPFTITTTPLTDLLPPGQFSPDHPNRDLFLVFKPSALPSQTEPADIAKLKDLWAQEVRSVRQRHLSGQVVDLLRLHRARVLYKEAEQLWKQRMPPLSRSQSVSLVQSMSLTGGGRGRRGRGRGGKASKKSSAASSLSASASSSGVEEVEFNGFIEVEPEFDDGDDEEEEEILPQGNRVGRGGKRGRGGGVSRSRSQRKVGGEDQKPRKQARMTTAKGLAALEAAAAAKRKKQQQEEEEEDEDEDTEECPCGGACPSCNGERVKRLKPNDELLSQLLCITCWDKTRCVLYEPCMHMVNCTECHDDLAQRAMKETEGPSASVTSGVPVCPTCRAVIKGTKKIFLT
uniref:RING-type domain-containing protein n=1 Tax=Chromera velia CCMP2878 TaxID=1169474 RepID=A0A0G4EZW3_9ALVE|eukprot:Cvel_14384.t1-p1 / transcript=Cvel_14384.t1 / gene=Cvel_14384 / organism=Chromera_velia_CCMP2878 / gene_product=hypothetical protein / transcript_product=hypothetical protein / location=Cvel_scaffold1021:4934-6394(+) / protein_length=487 / sequence_SO=supercontig / SO=protein_coding / is_pseudo=false